MRWEILDLKGIEDSWTLATPWYKRKLAHSQRRVEDFHKYDLIKKYRWDAQELEHDLKVFNIFKNLPYKIFCNNLYY